MPASPSPFPRTLKRLLPAVALLASAAAPLSGAALAATTDVVNVPGPNSTLQQIQVGPGSFFTSQKQQTFTAQQTGDLVGMWIAAACTGCGTDAESFINIHVTTPTQEYLLTPPLSTWEGGNSGNLQYVPLNGALPVKAGDTVKLTFGCSPASPSCLSLFNLVATGDQYTGGSLAELSGTGTVTPLNADLVFISEMDNIVAPAPQPAPPARSRPHPLTINDTDPAIHYTGTSWGYYASRGVGDLNDDVHATLANGDSAAYAFSGTGISYITEKSVDEGAVDVVIDGVLQQTVNAQSADHNLANQTLFTISGLTQGQHTISLTKRSGTYMLLDAFLVQTEGQTINDTDAGLSYSGSGWGDYAGRPAAFGDYQQDVHATLNNGDSVSYTFTGSGISYITEKSLDEGTVDVYLDGAYQGSVNAYQADVHNQGGQVLFTRTALPAGQHTLKLVKTSGTYMLLDALTVLP